MIKYCKEWEILEPEFKHVTGDFVVTFRGKITEEYLENLGLNERQISAVRYIKKRGKITNKEYQSLCPSVNRETLRKDLNGLIAKKIIVRRGQKRGVYYELA